MHQIPFIYGAFNNYLEKQKVTTVTTASERRKRLRLKRIVISEQNYVVLKRLGYAGDSFNDVITKLLRIQKNHQKKQQESDDDDNSSSNSGLFPASLSDLFERERQQLADLVRLHKEEHEKSNNQARKQ